MTRGASGTRAGCGCFTPGLAAIRFCPSTMALARRTATHTRASSSPGFTGTGTPMVVAKLWVVTLEGEERLHPVPVAIDRLRRHRGRHHRHRASRLRPRDSRPYRVQPCQAEPTVGLAARRRFIVSGFDPWSGRSVRSIRGPLFLPWKTLPGRVE